MKTSTKEWLVIVWLSVLTLAVIGFADFQHAGPQPTSAQSATSLYCYGFQINDVPQYPVSGPTKHQVFETCSFPDGSKVDCIVVTGGYDNGISCWPRP